MAGNFIDKHAMNNCWGTPEVLLNAVRSYFGGPIPLDPATSVDNPTKALQFYTEDDNGLILPWNASGVFINPPYSNAGVDVSDLQQIGRDLGLKRVPSFMSVWAAKIGAVARSGVQIIALLPCGARFSTEYWQDHILIPELRVMTVHRGRVSFRNMLTGEEKSGQNNYDSIIYGFNVDAERFTAAFRKFGSTFGMTFQRASVLDGFI